MNKTHLCLISLIFLFGLTSAHIVKGHKKTSSELTVVGQFVFGTGEGKNDSGILVEYESKKFNDGYTYWGFYFDRSDSWYKIKKVNCMDRMDDDKVRGKTFPFTSGETIHHFGKNSVRPHIWYAVVVNCPGKNSTQPEKVDVKYKVTFKNVDGSFIGSDQNGLTGLNAFYFVAFFLLTVVHGAAMYFLFTKRSLHLIVDILGVCLLLMVLSVMFVLIHWGQLARNGVGCPGCRGFGQFLNGISSVLFSVLLIMIASGWAITYHELQRKIYIAAVGGVYLFFYILIFIITSAKETTSASTQFVYAKGSLLGFVIFYILLSWLGVFGYFAYSLYTTFKEETQYSKRIFYVIFGVGYTLWFILPPLLNFISIGIDDWFRPRVVDAFQLTATFIGLAALVALLWPTHVERFFRIISTTVPDETI